MSWFGLEVTSDRRAVREREGVVLFAKAIGSRTVALEAMMCCRSEGQGEERAKIKEGKKRLRAGVGCVGWRCERAEWVRM